MRAWRGLKGCDEADEKDARAPLFTSAQQAHEYRQCHWTGSSPREPEFRHAISLVTEWRDLETHVLDRRREVREALGPAAWARSREFLVNKRDAPLLGPGAATDMDVLSQYTGPGFSDLPLPLLADYQKTLTGWVGNSKAPVPPVVPLTPWVARQPCAVFRGGATGGGTTAETNLRLRLCQLSAQWQMHDDILLDAALTSWNPRHKRCPLDGVIKLIAPDTAAPPLKREDAGRHNFLSMEKQATQYRWSILLDGNVGASRLGELATKGFLVFVPVSTTPQVAFYWLMRPRVHYVPVKADLSDLRDLLQFYKENDDAGARIASNLRQLAELHLSRQAIEQATAKVFLSVRSRLGHAAVQRSLWDIWSRCRASIYCLLDGDGRVRAFVPFANKYFQNDWPPAFLRTSPGPLACFLETATLRFGHEDVLEDTKRWWDNGNLICNVLPSCVWGESLIAEARVLMECAGKLQRVATRRHQSLRWAPVH
jgi:hypothetical protein